jgi:hypothetical protein
LPLWAVGGAFATLSDGTLANNIAVHRTEL